MVHKSELHNKSWVAVALKVLLLLLVCALVGYIKSLIMILTLILG